MNVVVSFDKLIKTKAVLKDSILPTCGSKPFRVYSRMLKELSVKNEGFQSPKLSFHPVPTNDFLSFDLNYRITKYLATMQYSLLPPYWKTKSAWERGCSFRKDSYSVVVLCDLFHWG